LTVAPARVQGTQRCDGARAGLKLHRAEQARPYDRKCRNRQLTDADKFYAQRARGIDFAARARS